MTPMSSFRLGDLGSIVTGRTPPAANPEFFGSEVPFLTPTGIDGVSRHITTGRFFSNVGASAFQRILLPPQSVCCVCIGATIGKVCLTQSVSASNQQINSIIVDRTQHDPRFVYYKLLTLGEVLKAHAGGAATPIVNKSQFSDLEVDLPELSIQSRSADLLSAYDDLIENNTRRIAILEEMARRIFEEWFVHFRAPGCEGLPMVDSAIGPMPQGWKAGPLEWLAECESASVDPRRFPEETFAHFSYPAFDKQRRPTIEAGDAIQSTKLGLSAPVVLLGKLNPRIPRIWLVLENKPFRMITSTEFMPLRARKKRGVSHLLSLVSSEAFLSKLRALTGGTSTSHQRATPRNVMTLQLAIPPPNVIQRYDEVAMPMMELAECLRATNANLRAQRDHLLPKLISGEIDLSAANDLVKEAAE
jgi:type I restriction enzyme S subunit